MIRQSNRWSKTKLPWLILFLSALGLLLSALYFQHILDHQPCVMCIYQRTAVIGVMFAALIPLVFNHSAARLFAYLAWGGSSIWGILIATEHLDILSAPNPFFAPCPIVPNFPEMLPLYDWLPKIFGAPGDCLDQSWQFLGMGMPSWMQIIFIIYTLVWVYFVMIKMIARRLKTKLG